jgi:nucleotide-binding universal stress UspA family protein
MFKNILVPLDGSETAEVVLDTAQGLAKTLGATLNLVRVVDIAAITRSIVPASGEMGVITQEIQDMIDEAIAADLKEAEDYLKAAGERLQRSGVAVTTELRQGVAGDELIEAINARHIDAVCIATHGRSGISRTIFGSVADRLIRESGKPVLVIKAKKQ